MTTDTSTTTTTGAGAGTDAPDDEGPSTRRSSARRPLTADDAARATSTGKAGTARKASIAPRRAPTPPSRPTGPGAAGAAGSTPRRRLPWILAALGLVGTLTFGGLWLAARGDDGSTSSGAGAEGTAVQDAAEDFSKALTNFDGSSIDADFDRIVALSTGDFRDEVDTFFSADTRKQLKEAQASSRGEVRSAYVQGVDGDRASAFVVLDQTIANNKSPQPKADTLRMELALRAVEGRWLVAQVNVLQAPSGGSTLPGATTATTTPKAPTSGG